MNRAKKVDYLLKHTVKAVKEETGRQIRTLTGSIYSERKSCSDRNQAISVATETMINFPCDSHKETCDTPSHGPRVSAQPN